MKNKFKKIKLKVLKEFNRKIAVKTTLTVGTMGCVYIFFICAYLKRICTIILLYPFFEK